MNLGKVGVIDCIYSDGRIYPYSLLINGKEFSFADSEFELVEKAIEMDAKPSMACATERCTKTIELPLA